MAQASFDHNLVVGDVVVTTRSSMRTVGAPQSQPLTPNAGPKRTLTQNVKAVRLNMALNKKSGEINEVVDWLFCPSRLLHILLELMSISVVLYGGFDMVLSVVMAVLAVIVLGLSLLLEPYLVQTTEAGKHAFFSYWNAVYVMCAVCEICIQGLSHKMLFLCLVTGTVLYFQILRLYIRKVYTDKKHTRLVISCILFFFAIVLLDHLISYDFMSKLWFKLMIYSCVIIMFHTPYTHIVCITEKCMGLLNYTKRFSFIAVHLVLFFVMCVQYVMGMGAMQPNTLVIFVAFYFILLVSRFMKHEELKQTASVSAEPEIKHNCVVRFLDFVVSKILIVCTETAASWVLLTELGMSNCAKILDIACQLAVTAVDFLAPGIFVCLQFMNLTFKVVMSFLLVPGALPVALCCIASVALWYNTTTIRIIHFILEQVVSKIFVVISPMIFNFFISGDLVNNLRQLSFFSSLTQNTSQNIASTNIMEYTHDAFNLLHHSKNYFDDSRRYHACIEKLEHNNLTYFCTVRNKLFNATTCVRLLNTSDNNVNSSICTDIPLLHKSMAVCIICEKLLLSMQGSAATVEAMEKKVDLRIGSITTFGKVVTCGVQTLNATHRDLCSSVNTSVTARTFEEAMQQTLNTMMDPSAFTMTTVDVVSSIYMRMVRTYELDAIDAQTKERLSEIASMHVKQTEEAALLLKKVAEAEAKTNALKAKKEAARVADAELKKAKQEAAEAKTNALKAKKEAARVADAELNKAKQEAARVAAEELKKAKQEAARVAAEELKKAKQEADERLNAAMKELQNTRSALHVKEQEAELKLIKEKEAELKLIEKREAELKLIKKREAELKLIKEKEAELKLIKEKEAELKLIKEKEAELKLIEEKEAELKLIEEKEAALEIVEEQEAALEIVEEQEAALEIVVPDILDEFHAQFEEGNKSESSNTEVKKAQPEATRNATDYVFSAMNWFYDVVIIGDI